MIDGQWRDHILMALTYSEWDSRSLVFFGEQYDITNWHYFPRLARIDELARQCDAMFIHSSTESHFAVVGVCSSAVSSVCG
ncbi:MAG: hypothetical protein GPOALKHO_000406 [Sodalis sp.]|nr:MAG: hypothetical protein GPOALKHO_000406 [Sodalis sp.]